MDRVAQVGFEPTACLSLNQTGLPVAYRATGFPLCPEWESNPQSLGFKPSRSAGWRIRAYSGRRTRTSILWFRARWPTVSRSPSIDALLHSKVRGEGFEPSSPDSKSGSLPLADPRIAAPALGEGPGAVFSGRRGSRTLKACARPGSGRMPSPSRLALPFQ